MQKRHLQCCHLFCTYSPVWFGTRGRRMQGIDWGGVSIILTSPPFHLLSPFPNFFLPLPFPPLEVGPPKTSWVIFPWVFMFTCVWCSFRSSVAHLNMSDESAFTSAEGVFWQPHQPPVGTCSGECEQKWQTLLICCWNHDLVFTV